MTVRFGVLGDVEARVGGRLIELGPARQRCVLAALLIDANQPMPVDQLADRVWGQHPPQRSLETLYSYLSRLRTVLAEVGDAHLSRRSGGYVLGVEADAVDLHRFRHLAAQARAVDDETRAPALLRDALELWRGTALRSLDTPWANATRNALEAERVAAERDLTDLRLRLGEHGALLGDLATQSHQHPLDERLAAQLMLALYRSGRTGGRARPLSRVRVRLAAELGIDPGNALQQMHQRILRGDPALATPRTARPAGSGRATPVTATSQRPTNPPPTPRVAAALCRPRPRTRPDRGGVAGRHRVRRHDGHCDDRRDGRHRQDLARAPLGARASDVVPGRPAVRESARFRPRRPTARASRGVAGLPRCARCARRPDPGRVG